MVDDPNKPPPIVFSELSQPPSRLPSGAVQGGPVEPPFPPRDDGPVAVTLEGVAAEGQVGELRTAAGSAAGEGRASGEGASVSEAVGSTVLSAEGGTYSMGNAALTATTRTPTAVGRVTIANRDTIVIHAMSIEPLLRDAIDRLKKEGSNSESVPELENILGSVRVLHQMLLVSTAAPAEANVGAQALSIKAGVAAWWANDHTAILSLGYKTGLFMLLVGLIVHFGLIPSTIAATLINKDVGDALKQLGKLLSK